MIFETKRLYTRPWQNTDIGSAELLWGDPVVTRLIDIRERLTKKEVKAKLDEQIQLQKQYGLSYWALVLKETDQIIGCCGLRPYDTEKNSYELGFHLIQDYWKKGYATEAALAAITYAFDSLQVRTLFAGHHPHNRASESLLKKLGFQYVRDEYYQPTGLDHPSYILENPRLSSEKIRKVVLSPYDKNWETSFERERDKLQKILGKNCIRIHHIGSTSIPGMYAKPIVDIMPVVADLAQVDIHDEAFERLGYECMGEYGIPDRRFYWKSKEKRTHHIHLFEEGNSEIDRHLAFRDYLRENREIACAYSQIKRDLAVQFENDIVSYVEGKSAFIKHIDSITGHPQSDQLLATDEIILKPYDPNWKKFAKAEIASIMSYVDLPVVDIKHLGSTAIEGMLAKPIIDIFIALDSMHESELWIKPLENMGYVFWSENPDKKHLRFFKGMPPFGIKRTHHVHIMEKGADFDRRVMFCDILNKSPEKREEYKRLKQDLLVEHGQDRESYTNNKAKFIKHILEQ